jgi:predicted transglutaminase-like cysteine proteinase
VSADAYTSSTSDSAATSIVADFPREIDQTICKLYVTPQEASLVALKNRILEDKFVLTPNWMALRDWVGNNIKYTNDSSSHQEDDYWQLPMETMQSGTGDCEDFAVLLCSLLRADGWLQNDVYVIVGEEDNSYHAWVRIIWNGVQYNIEPQANGWATVIGDFFSLSGYDGKYKFNDYQLQTIT